MIRSWNIPSSALVLALMFPAFGGGVAQAAQKQIVHSGAWRAIEAERAGRRVCFVISEPTSRMPADLKRDPGSLFVTLKSSSRGDGTEASIDFGFPLAATGHVAAVDDRGFALMSRGETAWLRSEADEAAIVQAMRAGHEMRVTAKSRRGNTTTDVYSLKGFTAAFAELQKRCRR
jgi:hypothetical protein